MQLKIDSNYSGQRCDRFIKKYFRNMPKTYIYKLFRKKDIKINGKRADASQILEDGDVVDIYISQDDARKFTLEKEKHFSSVKGKLKIVYEDDDVLVVFKDRFISVQLEKNKITLTHLVRKYLEDLSTHTYDPSPVHRLDTNTLGLVIFAKNYKNARDLSEKLRDKQVRREYLAVVKGKFLSEKTIELNLQKIDRKMQVSASGKKAITTVSPLIISKNYSLVRIELETGRYHQIRATLSHIGHPIAGDMKYSGSGNYQTLIGYKVKFYDKELSYIPESFYQEVEKLLNRRIEKIHRDSCREAQL